MPALRRRYLASYARFYVGSRQLGVQFRRQVVVGSRIVDFMAPAAGLVVEVDGDAYHALRTAADGRRDEAQRRAGYVVLRMQASLVVQRLEEAVVLVRGALPTPRDR